MRRAHASLTSALAALARCTAPADASRVQRSIFEDDQTLVLSSATIRERTLDDLKTLGVDTVHSVVFWNKVAPAPLSTHRPAGFDGSQPGRLPRDACGTATTASCAARRRAAWTCCSRPSSPMPAWASRCQRVAEGAQGLPPEPDPVQALRAGARHALQRLLRRRERGRRRAAARRALVDLERAQPGRLAAAAVRCKARACRPPRSLYRALAARRRSPACARPATAPTTILLGETAPIGRTLGPGAAQPPDRRPGRSCATLFCIDAHGRALRGARRRLAAAASSACRVTGFAHHPYTRGGCAAADVARATPTRSRSARSRACSDPADQAAASGRIPRSAADLLHGVRLPDQPAGHALRRVARQAGRLHQPVRLHGLARSARARRRAVRASSTRPRWRASRPACASATAARSRPTTPTGCRCGSSSAAPSVRVWGQLRPPPTAPSSRSTIQNAPTASGAFTTVQTVTGRPAARASST